MVDSNIGSGRMKIIDVTASKIRIALDFISPIEGHNVADFALEPNGNSTTVRWVMQGPNAYIGKVIGVFLDMDEMIGKDFEAGLANLKAMAEN